MSGAEAPSSAHRSTSGGTVHTQTANPELLALLRENSAPHHPHSHPDTISPHRGTVTSAAPSPQPAPQAAVRDSPKTPVDVGDCDDPAPASLKTAEAVEAVTGASEADPTSAESPQQASPAPSQPPPGSPTAPESPPGLVGRSISQTIIREDPAESHTGANHSVSATPVSYFLPSDTDSASSELARLVGTPSRKSFVLSAAISEVGTSEEGDYDQDTDGVIHEESEFSADHAQDQQSSVPASAVAAASVGGSTNTSLPSHTVRSGPAAPSPDLTNPQHRRFVTPYVSRRLKDQPVGRSSAVSAALRDRSATGSALNVPKDQTWSVKQAAKLKTASGETSGTPEEVAQVVKTSDSDKQDPELDLVDSLDLAADQTTHRSQHQQPNPAEADSGDNSDTRRSSTPVPVERGTSDLPKPKSPQQTAPSSQGESQGNRTANQADSLHPRRLDPNGTVVTPGGREAGALPLSVESAAPSRSSSQRTTASILKKGRDSRAPSENQSVHRVYVDSPTFTREEEEEYRFVSSRVDNHDEDPQPAHPTFRGLDEQAVSQLDSGAAAAAAAVNSRSNSRPFKQVRYRDEDGRYENRDAILRGGGHSAEPPPSRQFVIKAKSGSAEATPAHPPSVARFALPSGPSFDAAAEEEEEELEKEKTYQEELRGRVISLQQNTEDTVVPRLTLNTESEDFRDSLDIPEDVELDSERNVAPLNASDLYDQQRLYQHAMRDARWQDPPPPPPAPGPPPHHGRVPAQRQGYAPQQRQYSQEYPQPHRQGYGDAQRQGYGDAQRQGYGDAQRQGYGDAQRQGYDSQRQGYDSQRQGYDSQRQGYGDPQRQGYYADPDRQGYEEAQRQGYPEGYANRQRQGGYNPQQRQGRREGYGDAQPQGYDHHEGQGYPSPQRQAYGNPQGYRDPQREGYPDSPDDEYADYYPRQGNPAGQGYPGGEPRQHHPGQRNAGAHTQGYAPNPPRQAPGNGQPRHRQERDSLEEAGYSDPYRAGYGQGYSDPQGYAEQERESYPQHGESYVNLHKEGLQKRAQQREPQPMYRAGPQMLGYGDFQGEGVPQGNGYADPNQYYDASGQPPGSTGVTPRAAGASQYAGRQQGGGGGGYRPPQPAARPEPARTQHPAPPHASQQGGYYAQETQPPPSQGVGGQPPPHQPRGYPQPEDFAQQGYDASPQDGYYLTEPRAHAQLGYGADFDASDFGHQSAHAPQLAANGGDDTDRYKVEDGSSSQTSTAREKVLLPRPEHDYISQNKVSYGRPQKPSYKKLHAQKKEEEEKLNQVFVQPKVKGKGQKGSDGGSSSRYPVIAENPVEGDNQGAEELWAHRSASLARAKVNRGSKRGSNAGGVMSRNTSRLTANNNSAGSAPNTAAPPSVPPKAAPAAVRPLPAQPVHQGTPPQLSPMHQQVALVPVSQRVVTEDGQRISVDVNLRLISPPVGGHPQEGAPVGARGHRGPGLQYPADKPSVHRHHSYEAAMEDGLEYRHGRYSADDVLSSKALDGGREDAYTDDDHDYTGSGYTTNPYKKIPPIPSSSEAPRSAPVQSEGSYMLSYLREKEKSQKADKPWYRVYGLKDYKRMQKEVRLGTLGPDLENDTYKERRERFQRQMEYAKTVKDKNTRELPAKKPPAFPRPKEADDMYSKRKMAIEYAKNVPKPTIKPRANPYNNYEMASKLSPIAKPARMEQSPVPMPEPTVDVLDLEKLHERHEQDKRNADIIRQKTQGISS